MLFSSASAQMIFSRCVRGWKASDCSSCIKSKGKQIGSVLLAGELAAGDSVVNWKTTSARREIRSRFGGKQSFPPLLL